jgi:hypothetical protein
MLKESALGKKLDMTIEANIPSQVELKKMENPVQHLRAILRLNSW